MESAVMEEVLKNILQQQEELAVEYQKEQEARKEVFIKLEAFDKKLETLKLPVINEEATLALIKKSFAEIRILLEAQPKTVIHEKKFQMFPNKPEEYYRLIFGNLFKGLVILIVDIYTLVIINRYIREREYLHYKQAWQYLYSTQNEEQKQFLEKVIRDSEKDDFSIEARLDIPAAKTLQKKTIKPATK